jgi:prepilin-type N-terminal cleavage/methylation domain-containing protein
MRAASRARSAGFTLTEIMIAVGILGILSMLAVPNFRQLLRNYEVRGAAESVALGVQRARAEAVSRNASMVFTLGTGTSWTVDYVTKPVSTDPPVDSRSSTDSPNATMAGVASNLSTTATKISFSNIGIVIANADASPSLSRVTFTADGAKETLRVEIGAGGAARVCDPSLPVGNARAC